MRTSPEERESMLREENQRLREQLQMAEALTDSKWRHEIQASHREIASLKEQLEALAFAARRVLERMNPNVPWPEPYLDLLDAVGSASNPASDGSLCGEDKPGLQHASAARPLPSEDVRLQSFVRAVFGDEDSDDCNQASRQEEA